MDGAGDGHEVTPEEVSELRMLARLVIQLRMEMEQHEGWEFTNEQVTNMLDVLLGASLSKRTIGRVHEPKRVVYEVNNCPEVPPRWVDRSGSWN